MKLKPLFSLPSVSEERNIAGEEYSSSIEGGFLVPFIVKTLLCIFLFYLINCLVDDSAAKASLFQSVFLTSIPILVYVYLLLREWNWVWVIIGLYFLKCGIGVFHYLALVDPDYFLHPTSVRLTTVKDFTGMFDQVRLFANNYWGGTSSFSDLAYMPHAELYCLIAAIFNKIGVFILSIIPVNAFSSIMMATMIGYVTKLRKGNWGIAIILAGLFPMSLITSYFFRDMVGLFVATFFLICILLAKKNVLLWLIVASTFFYLQRTVYVFLPVIAYIVWLFLKNRSEGNNRNPVLILCLIPILCVASYFSSSIFEQNEGYLSGIDNIFMYLLFPVRYFMCIIGPFPWSNMLNSPESTFYLQDYIFSSAMFYITLRAFPCLYHDFINKKSIDYMVILALLIMISGIFNSQTRLSYIGFGVCFFIPYLSSILDKEDFKMFHLKYFAYMALFNILYVSLGVGGLSNIFK